MFSSAVPSLVTEREVSDPLLSLLSRRSLLPPRLERLRPSSTLSLPALLLLGLEVLLPSLAHERLRLRPFLAPFLPCSLWCLLLRAVADVHTARPAKFVVRPPPSRSRPSLFDSVASSGAALLPRDLGLSSLFARLLFLGAQLALAPGLLLRSPVPRLSFPLGPTLCPSAAFFPQGFPVSLRPCLLLLRPPCLPCWPGSSRSRLPHSRLLSPSSPLGASSAGF